MPAQEPASGNSGPASLTDRFGRFIRYLRVSVTDRCNLRCTYCIPDGEVRWKSPEEILSFEKIAEFVKTAVEVGIDKVRITGGEPLMRQDIARLVEIISPLSGLKDLALTTNGTMLERHAHALKSAGLHRINISLDSLDPDVYRKITGGGDLSMALRGITSAQEAGLAPVKLNCVVLPGINDAELERLPVFGRERGLQVQFIQRMYLGRGKPYISDPARIGRPPDCRACNRLRLTADGRIKPCLLSDYALTLSSRPGTLAEAIREAVFNKPERGERLLADSMMEVGG